MLAEDGCSQTLWHHSFVYSLFGDKHHILVGLKFPVQKLQQSEMKHKRKQLSKVECSTILSNYKVILERKGRLSLKFRTKKKRDNMKMMEQRLCRAYSDIFHEIFSWGSEYLMWRMFDILLILTTCSEHVLLLLLPSFRLVRTEKR